MKSERQISKENNLIGHLAKKEKKRLDRILKNAEKTLPYGNYRAHVVARLLKQSLPGLNTARKHVIRKLRIGEGIKLHALYVARYFIRMAIGNRTQKLVVQSVDGRSERQAVYNISVSFERLYYVNGVLSSNTTQCDHDYDALRYRSSKIIMDTLEGIEINMM